MSGQGRQDAEALWRDARDRDLIERHIPGGLLFVAAFELAMVVRNFLVYSGPAHVVMPVMQIALAAIAVAGWWRLRSPDTTPEQLQRGVGAFVLILGLALPLEQALTGDALLSGNLGLVIVAAGAVLLSHRVFAATCVVLVAAWVAALLSRPEWSISAAHQATFVAVALVAGVAVHWNRTTDRRMLTERLEATLEHGVRDELTGLWNRRGAREVWQLLAAAAERDHEPLWCLFFDVRGLKAVNDRLGHGYGDALLDGIGAALPAVAESGTIVSRWGGDEFCVFGAGSPPEPEGFAAAVVHAVSERIGHMDQTWGMSPGIGTAPPSSGEHAFEQLVDDADADMYRRRAFGARAQHGNPG